MIEFVAAHHDEAKQQAYEAKVKELYDAYMRMHPEADPNQAMDFIRKLVAAIGFRPCDENLKGDKEE